MVKRVVFLAALLALLLVGQTLPAAAEAGFTLSDFKVKHAVADIGATATVRLEGTIDRDLYALLDPSSPIRQTPSFDLQQSCASLTTPTETILATARLLPISFTYDRTVAVLPAQGRHLDWIVTLAFDPATDASLGLQGICPAGYMPAALPIVTSMGLGIWPAGPGQPPRPTKQGDLLHVSLTFSSGHTEY